MRKNRKYLWENLYIWVFLCGVTGTALCMGILFLLSFVLYNLTDVINSFTVFSVGALLSGAFIGGYLCGLFRRKNGLYEGVLCGFVMYLILLFIGSVWIGDFISLMSIKKLLLCVIISATGGVCGVNHKRPKKI